MNTMSEIQPKKGRVSPLRTRSMVAANVTAVMVIAIRVTGTLSTFQSTAIGLRLAVTINPPALDHVDILDHRRNLSRLRCEQKEGENHNNDALPKTEIKEGALEARILDHRLDRRDRQRGARAESRRGDACGKAALVGKPFQRIADAGAVDAAGADAGDDHPEIIAVERGCFGVDRPSDGAKDAANQNDNTRTVFIDEPAFDRHQPGL